MPAARIDLQISFLARRFIWKNESTGPVPVGTTAERRSWLSNGASSDVAVGAGIEVAMKLQY
ncbi:hypothetical protein [Halotalea alkalilenta]|uniref:hypothetical protein n=1 Tax=Halotalea alkalilenta TaxID=376489 RepID=UPI0012DF4F42|nr:hypothetical protein [Halotalea alkalilenta]